MGIRIIITIVVVDVSVHVYTGILFGMCEWRVRVGPSMCFLCGCALTWLWVFTCVCVYLDSVGRLCTGVYVWVLGLCSGEFVVHLCALAFFEVCVCVCVSAGFCVCWCVCGFMYVCMLV